MSTSPLTTVPIMIQTDAAAQTITVTVPFVLVGLSIVASLFGLLMFIRFVVLTKYARLPPVQPLPNAKYDEAPFDLRLNLGGDEDEFGGGGGNSDRKHYGKHFGDLVDVLRNVKAFGYLDKHVLNDLAKHLVTRKVRAGYTINTTTENGSEDSDFCIVLDGTVGVFVKGNSSSVVPPPTPFSSAASAYEYSTGFDSGADDSDSDGFSSDDDIENNEFPGFTRKNNHHMNLNGYHLLNQVKRGGVVSSMFSVLSVLTENMTLHSSARTIPERTIQSPAAINPQRLSNSSILDESVMRNLAASPTPSSCPPRHSSLYQNSPPPPKQSREPISPEDSKRPVITSIALTDTKLLILPSQAFRSLFNAQHSQRERPLLDNKWSIGTAAVKDTVEGPLPKAPALVAQVLVARFLKVTVACLEKYVGAMSELLEIERGFCGGVGMAPLSFGVVERVREIVGRKGVGAALDDGFIDLRGSVGVDGPLSSEGLRNRRRRVSPAVHLKQATEPTIAGDSRSQIDYVNNGLPGVVIHGDDVQSIVSAVFESVRLVLGIPSSTGNEYPPKPLHHRSFSVDSFASDTDDGMDSASVASSRASNNLTIPNMKKKKQHSPEDDVVIVFLERGELLVKEGERVPGLWFVIDGILEASVKEVKKGKRKSVFLVEPGNIAGYLSSVTAHPSLVTIKAKTDTQVGFISKAAVEKYVERHPNILLTLAKRLEAQISPLAYQVDFALDWGHVNAGQVLYRQGDQSNSIFIVLAGRLRSIGEQVDSDSPQRNYLADAPSKPNSKFEIYGEIGPGESIGELEVLTESRRPSTVHAIRDTEIAIVPKTLFNALAIRYPEMTIQISRMLAARSQGLAISTVGSNNVLSMNPFGSGNELDEALGTLIGGGAPNPALAAASSAKKQSGSGVESAKNNYNLKTVGILPVNSMVPLAQFAERLKQGLELVGASVALLNNSAVVGKMGKHVFSTIGRLKLMSWLGEQEDTHRLVLYVADGGIGSQWTQRCIRQADCILLVGLGDEDPAIGEYERLVLSLKTTARKELVLLHNERYCAPGSTAAWLKSRLWIHAHHHVQMPLSSPQIFRQGFKVRKRTSHHLFDELEAHFQRFYSRATSRLRNSEVRQATNSHTGIRSDFARLARRLLNKSIGLALGGGSARGIAHVGVLRALEEAGIPIDMIGGTSMGSFVSGLYARESNHVSIYARAKGFAGQLSSKWTQFLDLTYPLTSLFTGHELNLAIWKCFDDTQIEDCWIPFFAVTVNITDSTMEVHQSGYMWRYIRASMSLAGYFPPLCEDGKMLVDGGYLNLVPVDIIVNKGADVAIAVDVSLGNDTSPVTYGDSLSGWWLMLARLVPGLTAGYGRIPLLADIQDRLTFVGSVDRLEKAKKGEFYLCPPVANFDGGDFDSYPEIYRIGYRYGKEVVRKWEQDGTLEKRFGVVRNKVDNADRQHRRATVKYHYIREQVHTGIITLAYIATANMIADILAKALPRIKFIYFISALVSKPQSDGNTSHGNGDRSKDEQHWDA
ncbi:UNVERIFIED_CONTAM: phosphatidylcholine and lysophosphatidylcholine phospholipase [Siphonaria sp. JEL0065]|nr:phosphatidylcholine and lysophosphatidylcholine phospholipase [Siphonaria sp. JEL0065]